MDVALGEDDLIDNLLSLDGNRDEFGRSSDNVVVGDGGVDLLALQGTDLDVNEVSEDISEFLAPCIDDLVVLTALDGVLGDDGDGLLKSSHLGLPQDLLLILGDFGLMMFLIVNAMHAGTVTTLVVDEDEAFGASLADVAKYVVLAP